MAEKNVSVRLVATGGGQVRAELTAIGAAGDKALDGIGASATSASAGIKKVGQAANDIGRRGGGGDGFRNLGFQVQDFAVQVGAGTSAAQAMAQQLPQLASGFGPVGIAIGTLSAVLIPVGAALLGAAGSAGDMAKRMKEADAAMDALSRSSKAAMVPLFDLKKMYGESADEVERLNKANLAFDAAVAAKALDGAMDALGLSQGSFAKPMQGPQQPGMFDWLTEGRTAFKQSEYDETLTRLQTRYAITRDEAEKLAKALEAVTRAAPGAEAVAAAANLQEAMLDVAGSAGSAAEKFGGENGLWESARTVADLAQKGVAAVTAETNAMVAAFDTGISKFEQLRRSLDALMPGAGGVLGKAADWFGNFQNTTGAQWSAGSKGILDLIGWAEGTDKGRGYNETLGYGAFTGGPVNLVNMKIDEVLALQQRMLAHPDNTYNSSAVGRYQIVGKTLRGLKGQLGLSGDELFDESMQDRLAMELVRGRAGGDLRGWYNEWQGFEAKGVSLASINASLGVKSMGVDPAVAAARKKENDEMKRGLDLREDFVASLEKQTMAAAVEAQSVGQSAYEQARLRAEMMLTQDAKAKGIDLTETIAGTEKTYGQAIKDTAAALGQAAQEQVARQGQMDAAEEAAKRSVAAMESLKNSLQSGFDSAFGSIIDGTKSVAEAFRDMVAQMLAQAAAAQFSRATGGILDMIFGGFGAGGGDALSAALAGAGVRPSGGGLGSIVMSAASSMLGGPAMSQGRAAANAEIPVRVYVDDSDQLRAMVDRRAGQQSARMAQQVESRVPSIMDNHQRRNG